MGDPHYIMVRVWPQGIMQEAIDGGLKLEDGREFRLELGEDGLHSVRPADQQLWNAHKNARRKRRLAALREARGAADLESYDDAPSL